MEGVWHERDTTPAAIEAALRELLKHQHEKDEAYAPARVLNLLVVADREWRGEIQNRLEDVGRNHASRTILCAVEPGRTAIDAWATMITQGDPRPGELALCHEHLVRRRRPAAPAAASTRSSTPLLVTDIATLLWSPHGHPEAVDALLHLAQVVLIDSVNEPDPAAAIDRARARWPSRPTWSTWRGCARRRGASGSPARSTRRSGATSWAGSRRSPSGTARSRP